MLSVSLTGNQAIAVEYRSGLLTLANCQSTLNPCDSALCSERLHVDKFHSHPLGTAGMYQDEEGQPQCHRCPHLWNQTSGSGQAVCNITAPGEGRAGQGRAGQGRAGQGRAGQGRAGQGRAGQGRMIRADHDLTSRFFGP